MTYEILIAKLLKEAETHQNVALAAMDSNPIWTSRNAAALVLSSLAIAIMEAKSASTS